jgi:hypothetical protein
MNSRRHQIVVDDVVDAAPDSPRALVPTGRIVDVSTTTPAAVADDWNIAAEISASVSDEPGP